MAYLNLLFQTSKHGSWLLRQLRLAPTTVAWCPEVRHQTIKVGLFVAFHTSRSSFDTPHNLTLHFPSSSVKSSHHRHDNSTKKLTVLFNKLLKCHFQYFDHGKFKRTDFVNFYSNTFFRRLIMTNHFENSAIVIRVLRHSWLTTALAVPHSTVFVIV